MHTEFTYCLLYLVQNTIYKTAHLKVFTDYWMYPVSLLASIISYSKQNSTNTCYLCEVHSVLKEKKVANTSNCLVAVRARSRQLFYHHHNLVASARLALRVSFTAYFREIGEYFDDA